MSENQDIDSIIKPLVLSSEQYEDIMQILDDEMTKGLGQDTNKDAAIKMFPTYVRSIPDGSEEGNFLALDLGGTNFRVLLITLYKDKDPTMKSRIFRISKELMLGPGVELFDHIADCIYRFMAENKLQDMTLPLGFTFSFPCVQKGLAEAHLSKWTKGFQCEGVEGEDIVRLLHEAIARRKDLNVECLAVINDTVGTLMACAHKNSNCQIGLILGTGTNACYMENLDRVELWDGDHDDPEQVIINTEWGAFGDNGCLDFIMTDYDREVDKQSLNPGKQLFEKMISGMYMGEIVRLVLCKLAEEDLIFDEVSPDLDTEKRFFTKYVSEIEGDLVSYEKALEEGVDKENIDKYKNTRKVLKELGYDTVSDEHCDIVQRVCTLVSTRAAYLSAAGIATLLKRINKDKVTVGVDGSLFRYHPRFSNLMLEKINELLKSKEINCDCDLMLSADGSGKGAALVAAVAYRVKLQPKKTKSS